MTKIRIEEDALLELIRSGNPKGLSILYDNYSAALFGIIIRIVKEHAIAEDVLQESFLKIWKNFSKYDESKGRLFTWIVNISRNTAIDKIRSSEFIHENKNRSASEFVFNEELSFQPNTDTIDLKKSILNLSPEYREIINLLYYGGFSQSETAEILKIPLGTVKTRSRTAIQKLKEHYHSNGS